MTLNYKFDLLSMKMLLTTQQNHFKIELKKFEDDLLSRLTTAHCNFLDDISLVEQLENTKSMAAHIQSKVKLLHQNGSVVHFFFSCFLFFWTTQVFFQMSYNSKPLFLFSYLFSVNDV